MRRWLALALLACGAPEASLAIEIPSEVLDKTEWIEVGFVPGGCPPSGALAAGLPLGAISGRAAFKPGGKIAPLGLVPSGKYGLAAAARDRACAVLATGCAPVDLGPERTLKVTLSTSAIPSGACGPGSVCSYGRCLPPANPGDPSVGASCSLELMGAGPLGNPLAEGTQVGSPAVVATEAGFLIAYREFEPVGGIGRLTLFRVDNGGAALPAHAETLSERCPGVDEKDGVGLALSGSRGVVVLARSPCMGKSGYDYFVIDASGAVERYNVDSSAMGATLELSPAHAVAPSATPGQFLLGVRVNGTALLQTTDGVTTGKANDKLGDPMDRAITVTSSSKLVAAMVAGVSRAPIPDGGAPEGGAQGPVLRVHAGSLSTPLASLPAAIEIPAAWGSMAALGTRLVVVSNGDVGKPVAYRAFDLVGSSVQPGPTDGFNTNSLQGAPIFADVALVSDYMVIAVEQPGAIGLTVFDRATTMPVFKREIALGDDPRLPSIKTVRDGRLAVAASSTRVAVAWATGAVLGMNDPVGGYAVFACR